MSGWQQPSEVADEAVQQGRMDALMNIAARAWPSGEITGFCRGCLYEKKYNWEQMAKFMHEGFPKCKCNGKRIDFR